MDRKQKWMLLVVISIAVVSLAITAVTASPRAGNTPLYTYRMEQASSMMNFSPAAVDNPTYTSGTGWMLNYDVPGGPGSGVVPLAECTRDGCAPTDVNTCGRTCPSTCSWTCANTCSSTCVSTCSTCVSTCSSTCVSTCSSTCVSTCSSTCANTCWTCIASCNGTCASTCNTCYYSCEPDP